MANIVGQNPLGYKNKTSFEILVQSNKCISGPPASKAIITKEKKIVDKILK